MDGRWTDGRLWMLPELPSETPQQDSPALNCLCLVAALFLLTVRATIQRYLLASMLASCQDGLPLTHWIWLPDSNPLVAGQAGCRLGGWSGVRHWPTGALPLPHLGECS
jgi:hypothetical protein